jgi:hypothetical protein
MIVLPQVVQTPCLKTCTDCWVAWRFEEVAEKLRSKSVPTTLELELAVRDVPQFGEFLCVGHALMYLDVCDWSTCP